MTSTFVNSWNDFWYRPSAPENLGICRILFFLGLLVWLPLAPIHGWHEVPMELWRPLPLFEVFQLSPIGPSGFQFLTFGLAIAGSLACLGCCTRLATTACFLLSFYIFGLRHNFGHAFHYESIPIIVMGILSVSRCGDAYSMDRYFARKRGVASTGKSGEYTWPIQLVVALMCMSYFSAGFCKLQNSGLSWFASDNLKWSTLAQFYAEVPIPTVLGYHVAKHPWIFKTLGATALFCEIAAPLALLRKRSALKAVLGVGLVGMQLYIYLAMGPNFCWWIVCFAFWIPWTEIGGIPYGSPLVQCERET